LIGANCALITVAEEQKAGLNVGSHGLKDPRYSIDAVADYCPAPDPAGHDVMWDSAGIQAQTGGRAGNPANPGYAGNTFRPAPPPHTQTRKAPPQFIKMPLLHGMEPGQW